MSGRRKKHAHAEHHVDERWLVSYADMITVLMALFIVLYAMSTVDSHKFDQLKNSLASGFGVTNSKKVDLSKGVPVPKDLVDKNGAGFTASTTTMPLKFTKELKKALQAADAKAKVSATANTVTISLIGSRAYFDGNKAALRPEAVAVLKAIGPVLKKHPGRITVEGHADPRGSSGSYGNDWNLAAARATSVLVWLVDRNQVRPEAISSISYGSEHAIDPGSPTAIEKNRRVDIVVHTDQAASAPTGEGSDGGEETASTTHGSSGTGTSEHTAAGDAGRTKAAEKGHTEAAAETAHH